MTSQPGHRIWLDEHYAPETFLADITCADCGRPAFIQYRKDWYCRRCFYDIRCEEYDRDTRYEGPAR